MCSCFTTFPGFFRHHLQLLRSVLSFLRFSFRSLHLSRQTDRSSHRINTSGIKSNSTKRVATEEIKVTLGSRVDGRGCFISLASVFPADSDWLPLSQVTGDSNIHADDASEPTHREYYEEMIEEQRSHIQYPPSSHCRHPLQNGIESASPTTIKESRLPRIGRAPKKEQSWWKIHRQPESSRTSYGDVPSFIRKGTAKSFRQSKMQSTGNSSAV